MLSRFLQVLKKSSKKPIFSMSKLSQKYFNTCISMLRKHFWEKKYRRGGRMRQNKVKNISFKSVTDRSLGDHNDYLPL